MSYKVLALTDSLTDIDMYLDSAKCHVRPLLQLPAISPMLQGSETDNAMAKGRLDAPKHVPEMRLSMLLKCQLQIRRYSFLL